MKLLYQLRQKRRLWGWLIVILPALLAPSAHGQEDGILPLFIPAIMGKPSPWPEWPAAGNPDGNCAIPAEAQAEDTSNSDVVIGDGSPESCTGEAVVSAVAQGGIITFDCGPRPVTITMTEPAKIFNNTGPKIVIDGGGKVALSGGDATRILYMNTCDPDQIWTTPHCQDQDHPQLTVQNLVFVAGNSSGEEEYDGGGAIWARGGRLKIVNCRFFDNVCAPTGPDLGGAAVRAFSQWEDRPLYVVNSTFGGSPEFGNSCSNGGGLSSIGVSYSVYNSVFTHNTAIGYGANPQRPDTPGGGSGGAIYNDGNDFDLNICGTRIENNSAREGGGAVFFVSNNRTGHLIIKDSLLRNNPSENFENYPGIFYLGDGDPDFINSIIE